MHMNEIDTMFLGGICCGIALSVIFYVTISSIIQ